MAHYTYLADGWKRVGKEHPRHGEKGTWAVVDEGKEKVVEDIVTSFFIREFGNKWSAKNLFYELKEYSDLDEIVIPPKRDRRVMRYGFSRFLNMRDDKVLAIKLYIIVLEDRKLFVNLLRFQRSGNIKGKLNGPREIYGAKIVITRGERNIRRFGPGWVDNRSFADVMKNRKYSA